MIILVLIAIAVAWFAVRAVLCRKRTEAIQQLADTINLTYRENPVAHLPDAIWHFDLFNKGHSRTRRVSNLLKGHRDNVIVSIADYQYTSGSGKHKSTHRQTLVLMESSHLHLPDFLLTPENLFHKIGKVFGYQDINFEAYPEFSNRYLLRGSDENLIRQQFHSGVLNLFQNRQGIVSQGIGSFLLYYQPNYSVPPEGWQQFLTEALAVCEQLEYG